MAKLQIKSNIINPSGSLFSRHLTSPESQGANFPKPVRAREHIQQNECKSLSGLAFFVYGPHGKITVSDSEFGDKYRKLLSNSNKYSIFASSSM